MISKLFVLAIFMVLSPLSMADTIVIYFSGTLTTETNSYGNTLTLDTPYSGQLVYTLPAVLQYENAGDIGYSLTGPNDGISIGSGILGSTGASQSAEVEYQSNELNGNDLFSFTSTTFYPPYFIRASSVVTLTLVGSPDFLQSSAMPTEINSADLLPGYGAFNTTSITIEQISDLGGYQQFYTGTVDSVQLTELPEPTSIILITLSFLGFGLAIAGKRYRRHIGF